MDSKLTEAVALIGGPAAVGKELGITSQAVSQWRIAPAERCLEIERLTGGEVTRYDLRPDIFGMEP
jgi:DNA-binding transcriptional regulator YdaS (Cro superfamily)